MRFSRGVAVAMCVIALVVVWGASVVSAADAPVKIAVVDLAKLDDSPRLKQYNEQFNGLKTSLDNKLTIRGLNLLLNDTEITELVDLKTKDTPTDVDKARIKVLEDKSNALNAELAGLRTTSAPTDVQKARQTELTQMEAKSKDTGKNLATDYESQLRTKYDELMTQFRADAKEASGKVAAEKGYTYVLASDAVLFGGTDITDLVIAKLDRKVQ